MSFSPRSLTVRLIFGVTGLVTVLVVAIGGSTYFGLRAFLSDQLDQQLIETANQNFSDPRDRNGFGLYRGPQDLWFVVLTPAGDILGTPPAESSVKMLNLTAADRAKYAANLGLTGSVTTTDGHHLRVTSRVFRGPVGVIAGTTVVGLSTEDFEHTLERLVAVEVVIGLSAVGLALLLTLYGVRLSLRPLHRVTRTAQEVTAELSPDGAGLERRVPVTDAETEVGRLATSVNTLLEAVGAQFAARVESEERMRQFLADASHELRTPLTSIRGYAELDRLKRAQGLASDVDSLDRIEAEGTRMSRLVDDLLLLARSDQGATAPYEAVDVAELLSDSVTGSRAAFPNRQFDLTLPHGLIVDGDHDQLVRAVRNICDNAAVHAANPGPIRVFAAPDLPDGVIIQVSDPGPGLPTEEAAHVFERFWRADKARSRARGGSGLGLSIVASIVSAHGGSVDFASSPDAGSTVTIWLPCGGRQLTLPYPAESSVCRSTPISPRA